MNIPNLQLPADIMLDPSLTPLLQKLSHDKPNWFFRVRKGNTGTAWQVAGERAPDNYRFAPEVDVIQDNRLAGSVGVDRIYTRSGNVIVFYAISKRIDNGRRGHKVTSKKMDVIVRTVKKSFIPANTGEILYETVSDVEYRLQRVLNNLRAPMVNGTGVRSVTGELQIAMYHVLRGEPIPADYETMLRDKLLCRDFEEATAKYLLGTKMLNRNYKAIHVIEGDYCFFTQPTAVDDIVAAAKAEVTCCSFDELPREWQDKIAVLQLMANDEVVLDVGFRFTENTFMIVV